MVRSSTSRDHHDSEVFIMGISGAVGGLLARRLVGSGATVRGLVRTEEQSSEWTSRGADVEVGDLTSMSVADLSAMLRGVDAVVYTAGSNGGAREVTDAIDGEGVAKTVAAAGSARVRRLILVSVMPEAWRDRDLDDDEEHYFATKKRAEVLVSHSDLAWVILRPSLLLDTPGTGHVSLGSVEMHDEISREDVAETLAELLVEGRIRRQILELNAGSAPIARAVQDNVHR